MMWAIFPIFASIFYCVGGYIQNFLTDTALPKKRAGALTVMHIISFAASLSLLFAIFGRAVMIIPLEHALGLILAGGINVIGAVYYYKAIQKGDNIDIVVFGQVAPLISIALGVVLLGEIITANQALGFLFMIGASALVVFGNQTKSEKQKPNLGVAIITIIYCFFSVLSDIVYAMFISDGPATIISFAQGFFYFQLGSLLMSLLGLIFFPTWRHALRTTFFTGKKHKLHFAAELADNLMLIGGEILYKFGLVIAPVVSLVSPIGRVASLFANFIMTLCFGRIFPKFIHAKRFTKRMILNYIIAAILIVVGIVMMN